MLELKESILNLDHALFEVVYQGLSSEVLNKLLKFFYLSSWTMALNGGLVILIGWALFKSYRFKGLLLLALTLLQLSLVDASVSPLKSVFKRSRPEFTDLGFKVAPRLKSETSYSFPSGHAVDSFFLATLLGLVVPGLRFFLFLTAVLVSVSRVYAGLHFPADVFAGAVYGGAWGWLLFKIQSLFLKNRKEKRYA